MEQFTQEFFGSTHPGTFLALMLIALFSQYMSLAYVAKKKYKRAGADTPARFSLGFLFLDHLQRFVIGLGIAYFGVRGSNIFFQTEATFAIAAAIGPLQHVITGFFRKGQKSARK